MRRKIYLVLLAMLMVLFVYVVADAQRTQLGSGALTGSTVFTIDNPLFYVDTTGSGYWKRANKNSAFSYVNHDKTIVIHDTVKVTTALQRDTIWYSNANYTPEQFGAVHASKTFAQAGITQLTIDKTYPGIGATVNDMIDWAALKYCIVKAVNDGVGAVDLHGKYWVNREINMGKTRDCFLQINGNWSSITTTNTDSFSVFLRPRPVDVNESNLMVNSVINFGQMIIYLSSKQTAIELNCLYGGKVEQIWAWRGQELVHMRFCMGMRITHNYAQFTRYLGTAENGDWTGSTSYNSQSNAVTWESNHHACQDAKGITYRIYGSSDNAIRNDTIKTRIIDGISEQYNAKNFIDFDGRGFGGNFNLLVQNCHIEYTNGFTDAAFRIRCRQGIFVIEGCNFPGPGSVMVDAWSETGAGSMRIENCYDWTKPANGITFRNYNFSWDFVHNQAILGNMNIPAMFQSGAGYIVPQACPVPPACGYNRYRIQDIPR